MANLVEVLQNVKPLDQETYRGVVSAIFTQQQSSPKGRELFDSISNELTQALFDLYNEGSITDVSIFVPLILHSQMPASMMKTLMVQIILSEEMAVDDSKVPESNLFSMNIRDFISVVILNQSSHLLNKDKISIMTAILATNSNEAHDRLMLHNEILRRQIFITQILLEESAPFLLDVNERLIDTK